MLKVMRENVQSKFIKGLLWAVVVSFVAGIFLIYGSGQEGLQGNTNIVAKAGDIELDRDNFNRMFAYYTQGVEDKNQRFQAANRVITDFIREQVWLKEAEELGLEASPKELFDAIMDYRDSQGNYVFRKEDGKFVGEEIYTRMLSRGTSVASFENSLKSDIKLRKLRSLLMIGIDVTDAEALEFYKLENEKITGKMVKFDLEQMKTAVDVKEDLLQKYYEDKKEDFKKPDSKKYAIVTVGLGTYMDTIEIKDGKAKDYYDDNLDEFKMGEQRLASHILLKVEQNADKAQDDAVKKSAEALLARVKKGEDFAKLAKTHSEDVSSAVNGGRLSYVERGAYQKPFDDAVFEMKVDEIRGLVKTVFGYHIIKLDGIKSAGYKKFEEVQSQIVNTLKRFEATENRDKNVEAIEDSLDASEDWEALAKEKGYAYSMTEFSPEGSIPQGLPYSPEVLEFAAKASVGDISPMFTSGDNIIFVRVAERKESYFPELDEVREEVEDQYKSEQAKLLAEKAAKDFIEAVNSGRAMDELATEKNMTIEPLTDMNRKAALPGIGMQAEVNYKLFDSQPGTIAGPFEYHNGYLVAMVDVKSEVAFNEFLKDSERIKSQLLNQKQNAALMANLEIALQGVDYEINQELLKELVN